MDLAYDLNVDTTYLLIVWFRLFLYYAIILWMVIFMCNLWWKIFGSLFNFLESLIKNKKDET